MPDGPDIVVTGYRITSTFQGIPIGGGTGSGGDTSGSDQQAYIDAKQQFESTWQNAKPTPCATLKPSQADIALINGHALAALDHIKNNDGAHREILVVIWVDNYNGSVGKTLGQTSNQTNFVSSDFDLLPANVTVVAAIHSHTLQADDQPNPLPSNADRQFFESMRNYYNQNPQGIGVADNPLFYIWDAKSNSTAVYDRIKINGETVQCKLESAS